MRTEDLRGDLVTVAGLVSRPVTVDELAAALHVDAETVMQVASDAEAQGAISALGGGYCAPDPGLSPRVAHLASQFADALVENGGAHEEVAALLRIGRRDADAVPHLLALADRGDHAAVEALLRIHDQRAALDQRIEGGLRVRHAAHLAALGRNDEAFEEAMRAARHLEGIGQVEAMGFAAAIADNLQHPQQCEVLAALAIDAALESGEVAEAGSLLSLQAYALSRLGFPAEADRALEKSDRLLAEAGSVAQRRMAHRNRAAILLDRGEFTRAASEFQLVLGGLEDDDDTISAIRASLARALFGSGRSGPAMALARDAIQSGEGSEATPSVMLGHLAVAEGALAHHCPTAALEAVDAAMAAVEDHLPQWANRLQVTRAEALLAAGKEREALGAVAAGIDATPRGADGWRIRLMLESVEARTDAGSSHRRHELIDELLRARWFGSALPLMIATARREADRELGLEAAALALRIGAPLSAAEALDAVGAWGDPAAVPVAAAMQDLEGQVAAEWVEAWRTQPAVATAMGVDTSGEVDPSALDVRADAVLRAAGTPGVEVVLSPLQRRARGTERSGRPRLVEGRLRQVAFSAVAVLVALALVIWSPGSDDPPTADNSPIYQPEILAGTFAAGGTNHRTGEGVGGFREWKGIAWEPAELGGTSGTPVSHGARAFVSSSTDDVVYSIDLRTGRVIDEIRADDRILAAPAVGRTANSQGYAQTLLVAVSQSGSVYAKDLDSGGLVWRHDLGSEVEAAPVIAEGLVVVGTRDGRLVAFDGGSIAWHYPEEGATSPGRITAPPAFDDGLFYVTAGRELIAIEPNGAEHCRRAVSTEATVGGPMLSDGTVFVLTAEGFIRVDHGECGPAPGDPRVPISQPAAFAGGLALTVEEQYLFAFEPGTITSEGSSDVDSAIGAWTFDASTAIQGQPSIADGVVYIGTRGGLVHAIDLETGDEVWRFDVGSPVRGSVAPIQGAVLVSTSHGEIIAITGD